MSDLGADDFARFPSQPGRNHDDTASPPALSPIGRAADGVSPAPAAPIAIAGNRQRGTKTPLTAIDQHISRRVRELRILRGMTQSMLAELLGVTSQQINKNELGVNRFSVDKLFRLSVALNVPVAWFFEGLGPAVGRGVLARHSGRPTP